MLTAVYANFYRTIYVNKKMFALGSPILFSASYAIGKDLHDPLLK